MKPESVPNTVETRRRAADDEHDPPDSGRRRVLAATAAALAGFAGCSSPGRGDPDSGTTPDDAGATVSRTTASDGEGATTLDVHGPKHGDDLPPDDDPDDGYPPSFDVRPERRPADPSTFERMTVDGVEVPLVPVDVAYYWYARREARVVDARAEAAHDVAHVFGAVLSPAPDGRDARDPVADWPTDDRIVTYCACPHHLSTLRAANLLNDGYERVYAIDEGFTAWRERGYPLAGTDTDRVPEVWTVRGTTAAADAGGTAWAYDTGSSQMEATTIDDDGDYVLEIRFVNVSADSQVRVETPAYEVTRSLGAFANARVTAGGELVERTSTESDGGESMNGD